MASGDVFTLTPHDLRPGGVAELKLQLVEADRVSNPYDTSDTATRVDGIELREGQPVGCWVRNTHPGDRLLSTTPVKWTYYAFFGEETGRRRVLQVWNDKERPGQVRGASYLAPILEPLKQIERYSNAELMAAVLSAMLTVFIERAADGDDGTGAPASALGETAAEPVIALGNGAVIDLAAGEKANPVNPLRPNVNFDPFFVAVVKQIGAALELPVDELLLTYNASYSAARAAMLQAWRFYTTRRWALTQQFCQPVYGLRIDEEVASGRLVLPGYADPIRRRAYTRALWIGPARGSMDEEKEAKAAGKRIEIGVSNEAIETAAMVGEDWHAVHAQRVREVEQRKRDGTWVSPKPSQASEPDPAGDETPAKEST
jgi:lambda family phage portal protein